jgi:hypothetical protein
MKEWVQHWHGDKTDGSKDEKPALWLSTAVGAEPSLSYLIYSVLICLLRFSLLYKTYEIIYRGKT